MPRSLKRIETQTTRLTIFDACEMEMAHVVTVRQGKATRVVEYADRADAVKAVGLD